MDLHLQKISFRKSKENYRENIIKDKRILQVTDQLTNSLVFSENHPSIIKNSGN